MPVVPACKYFSLPPKLPEPTPARMIQFKRATPKPDARRILVIDDEASFTRMIKLNLEATGDYAVGVQARLLRKRRGAFPRQAGRDQAALRSD